MAEYITYHENVNYDMESYERLAAAIIRMAYEDYVDALKRVQAFGSQSTSRNRIRHLERILAGDIAERNCKSLKWGYAHLYLATDADIENIRTASEQRLASLTRWFYSDSFLILSKNVAPKVLIDKAVSVVDEWMSGRKKTTRPKRYYHKREEELT